MTRNQIANATQPLLNKLSRRYALSCFGGGGFATAFLLGSNSIAKATDQGNSGLILANAWVYAYNQNDAIAQANLYTDNGIFEDVPNNFQIKGTSNIQCFLEGNQKLFSNIKVELQDVFGDENFAVAEYFFSATNIGFIPDPKVLGKSFKVRTATVFVIENGKIARSSDYYDNTAVLVQLGVIPPLPAATPPTASCS